MYTVVSLEIEARCAVDCLGEVRVVWAVDVDEVVPTFGLENAEVFLEAQVSFFVDLSFPQLEGDLANS